MSFPLLSSVLPCSVSWAIIFTLTKFLLFKFCITIIINWMFNPLSIFYIPKFRASNVFNIVITVIANYHRTRWNDMISWLNLDHLTKGCSKSEGRVDLFPSTPGVAQNHSTIRFSSYLVQGFLIKVFFLLWVSNFLVLFLIKRSLNLCFSYAIILSFNCPLLKLIHLFLKTVHWAPFIFCPKCDHFSSHML